LSQFNDSWGRRAQVRPLTEKSAAMFCRSASIEAGHTANRPIATGPGGLHFSGIAILASLKRRSAPRDLALTGGEIVMPQQGTIKFFNADKGYGFIKPSDGGRDIFVHITAVEQAGLASLNEGQKISFEVEPDKKGKGPKAVNLHLD
jgi:CspA family cold shock protein